MPSLSFTKTDKAKPIAIVRGGDKDGEVLYCSSEESSAAAAPKREINASKYEKELKFLKPSERVKVLNQLIEGIEKGADVESLVGVPEKAKAVFSRIKSEEANDKSIELPMDSCFQPIPDPDPKVRQVWYVAGQSGSGKSYFARGIAEAYKKLFPDREIYLISKLNEDSTLDTMKVGKPKRISLDSLVSDPVEMEELRDCLIIADDWDTLDKVYFDKVHKLIEDICIMGRHTNTSILILSHYLTNYKKTRLMLNEAHYLVLYPMATSFKALKYVCENYGGADKEHCMKMKKLGRWIVLAKNYPSWLMGAHTCELLHS
jgi:hypothetical protein